ncbi:MAG: COR domain-containing protein [Chitinophagales bacterium]
MTSSTAYSPKMLDHSRQKLSESDLSKIWQQIHDQQIEFVDLSYEGLSVQHLRLPAHLLQSVRYLYLNDNPLQSIDITGDLPRLEILQLGHNQLKQFSLPSGFAALEHLRLDKNQLEVLKITNIDRLKSMRSLFLKGNRIQNVVQQVNLEKEENSWETYCKMCRDAQQSGVAHDNEIKVILIGNGSVGKTQIARRLQDDANYSFADEHDSTHAIQLLQKELDELQLNIWDFGGQDIYHATHRLFMQTNALFLLVWDSQNEAADGHTYKGNFYENKRLPYWLEYIKCFGKSSPVVLLQNKIDREGEEALNNIFKEYYQSTYPNIVDFLELSAKEDPDMVELEEIIEEIYLDNDSDFARRYRERKLIKGWIEVRDHIRKIQAQKKQKTVSVAIFGEWCKAAGINESQELLLDFLHDSGVVFYRPPYFSGNIILDQGWAIEAIYKVFDKDSPNYRRLQRAKGKLNYRILRKIWDKKDYSDSVCALFLDFMMSCELCFETTPQNEEDRYTDHKLPNRTFVVPQFLPLQMPKAEKETLIAHHQLKETVELYYRFLPAVFMQRFIVQTKYDVPEERYRYQQSVLLEVEGRHVLVCADYQRHCIQIHYAKAHPEIPSFIKAQLEEIAEEAKVRPQKADKQEDLRFAEKFKLYEQYCQTEKALQKAEEKPAATPQLRQLFISHSIADERFLGAFLKHISPLQSLLMPWSEQDVLPSQNWKVVSDEKLQSADVIVLLVSADFLADKNKWENELQKALKRQKEGKLLLVPILVRSCLWKESPFSHLLVLPRDTTPIDLSNNEDAAWTAIVTEIKDMLAH